MENGLGRRSGSAPGGVRVRGAAVAKPDDTARPERTAGRFILCRFTDGENRTVSAGRF